MDELKFEHFPKIARLSREVIISEKIDGIEFQILASVVIAHDGFGVFMPTHHLHLPIGESLIQGAGDGRAAQVVWRQRSQSTEVAPFLDQLMHHAHGQGFIELQRPVIH